MLPADSDGNASAIVDKESSVDGEATFQQGETSQELRGKKWTHPFCWFFFR